MKKFILSIIIIIFIIGLIFYCTNSRNKLTENFENRSTISNLPSGNKIPKENCPNVLLKKNDKIFLYNANLARVPGINPVIFESLEEYTEFYEWQKSQNINCPVLFLDTTYDTQNNEVYKVTQNPFQQPEVTMDTDLIRPGTNPGSKFLHPLVNANRSSMLAPYNQGPQIPADFDPNNQYIGVMTPLDKIFKSNAKNSPNPMDPNWGGHSFTQAKIDEGVFAKDQVRNPKSYGQDKLQILGQTASNHSNTNLKGSGETISDSTERRRKANAMKDDWVGASETNKTIDQGYFKGNEVKLSVNN